MNEQEFTELAAGHALHALSPEDAAAFDSARRLHPEWEHHVEADAATAALLADDVAELAPPAGIRQALLAQISATSSAPDADHSTDFGATQAPRSDRPQQSAPPSATSPVPAASSMPSRNDCARGPGPILMWRSRRRSSPISGLPSRRCDKHWRRT